MPSKWRLTVNFWRVAIAKTIADNVYGYMMSHWPGAQKREGLGNSRGPMDMRESLKRHRIH